VKTISLSALLLAYVLPSYAIVKKMCESRDNIGLTTLKVDGAATVGPTLAKDVATALNVDWVSGELYVTFSASMKFPGRCHVELSSPNTTKKVVAVSSNGKKRNEGLDLPALQVATDEICALLVVRGKDEARQEVDKHLQSLKVNKALVSLGRFHGALAWVVGDAGEAPQLWVYKPLLNDPNNTPPVYPARVRFTDDKSNKWDVQLYDWGSAVGSDWFPRVVEVIKGGEPQLKLTALTADVKPKLADELF
jgi:hypothetical protein